jgi:hypothetical protein
MSEILDSDKTYRIETRVSVGQIEDPITGEQHKIDPYEDDRGGTIEVDRPDSAKYIVDKRSRRRFVGKAPSADAVKEAQREEFDFAGNEICEAFAERFNQTLGSQTLEPTEGFDPMTGQMRNDTRLKIAQMYESLQDSGYSNEAEYLRALGSLSQQEEFVTFVREQLGVTR